MPNLAQVLKDEIHRLARKEFRAATSALKSDNAALKRFVAQLKRQVAALERDVRWLKAAEKRLREGVTQSKTASDELEQIRFTAKGIRSLRTRLGVSQAEIAELVGVSGQAVYVWENKEGRLNLRTDSKAALAELRTIGVREARRRLEEAA
jgi:DNA-binding transcriptional regulator YiaG